MAHRPSDGAIVSCFGDITPAFAAASGARIDVALPLGARNAEARAVAAAAREQRRTPRREVLPVEIDGTESLPASRVQVATAHARGRTGPTARLR
jgi:hypothetical protein